MTICPVRTLPVFTLTEIHYSFSYPFLWPIINVHSLIFNWVIEWKKPPKSQSCAAWHPGHIAYVMQHLEAQGRGKGQKAAVTRTHPVLTHEVFLIWSDENFLVFIVFPLHLCYSCIRQQDFKTSTNYSILTIVTSSVDLFISFINWLYCRLCSNLFPGISYNII